MMALNEFSFIFNLIVLYHNHWIEKYFLILDPLSFYPEFLLLDLFYAISMSLYAALHKSPDLR